MDRWKIWFSALEELGESIDLRYGKIPVGGGEPEWGVISHSEYDGIGVFAKLFREHEGVNEPIPKIQQRRLPMKRRLHALWRTLNAPKRPSVPWKHFDPTAPRGLPKAAAFTILSKEETSILLSPKANRNGLLNCRLLWGLDKAVATELANSMDHHLWLMPINLRGAVAAKNEYSNQFSYLPIDITANGTALDVQKSLRASFGADIHWGVWDAMAIRSALGKSGAKLFIKQMAFKNTSWFGTFSYGGIITGENARYHWFGAPPVTLAQPIGAGALTHGGHTSLTIQMHGALSQDPKHAERLVSEWKRYSLESSQVGS